MTGNIIKKALLALFVVISGGFIYWQGGTVNWSVLFQDALKGEASNAVQQVEDLNINDPAPAVTP